MPVPEKSLYSVGYKSPTEHVYQMETFLSIPRL